MVSCTSLQRARKFRLSDVFLALLIVCLATLPAFAQTATGNIVGYVKDTSGAAVPNVTVTARMVEQQASRAAQTNAEGY